MLLRILPKDCDTLIIFLEYKVKDKINSTFDQHKISPNMKDLYMVMEVRLVVFFIYTKISVKYKIWRQK